MIRIEFKDVLIKEFRDRIGPGNGKTLEVHTRENQGLHETTGVFVTHVLLKGSNAARMRAKICEMFSSRVTWQETVSNRTEKFAHYVTIELKTVNPTEDPRCYTMEFHTKNERHGVVFDNSTVVAKHFFAGVGNTHPLCRITVEWCNKNEGEHRESKKYNLSEL